MRKYSTLLLLGFCIHTLLPAQQQANMQYHLSMEKAASHYYHVELDCTVAAAVLDFKISAWTPGYYQIMNYAGNIENFKAADAAGNSIAWQTPSPNTWRVHSNHARAAKISYDVKASKAFVAEAYLDETRGYIVPGALFLYLDSQLRHPVTVQVQLYKGWKNIVATGLDSVPGQQHRFYANDFDVLYDSPFLMGELETLPPFYVGGKPHYFTGYQLGEFDRKQFIADLKKIVESSVAIIGDIVRDVPAKIGGSDGFAGEQNLDTVVP